jgi:hypothetical protein
MALAASGRCHRAVSVRSQLLSSSTVTFVLWCLGTRPQGHLARELSAAGPGITEAHAVVTVNLPHGLFHHRDPLLVPGPEDQVERLAGVRNDLELQLVAEACTL